MAKDSQSSREPDAFGLRSEPTRDRRETPGGALLRTRRSYFDRRFTGLIAALFVMVVSVVAYVNYAGTHAGTANRSGLPWKSGLFNNGGWDQIDSNTTAFGNWRGRAADVVVSWPERTSWGKLSDTAGYYDLFRNKPYQMVFGLPPFPEDGSSNLSACSNGSYNGNWKTIATTLKNEGLDSSIIRLGWEFNGDWYQWKASNAAAFAGCYRQIHDTAEAIAPNLQWDWTVNRGQSAGLADPTQAWPGDGYVDYVGVDSYNWWNDWNTQLNGGQGLNYWLAFAKQHKAKLSVPEWGASAANSASNGDQASYILNMFNFFKANAADIGYESYFNESADYHKGAIYNPNQNPNSAGQYQTSWKAGAGTVVNPTATAVVTPAPAVTPTPVSGGQVLQTGNLVKGKTFTSSVAVSTSESGNPVGNVNDGNEATRWISQPQDNATLTADLGASYKLNKVSILWAGDTVKDYQIQTSTDNNSWITVATGTTNNTQKQLVNITNFTVASSGRYFRIVATNRWNTAYGNSIWEIGVYGATAAVTPAPGTPVPVTPAPTPAPAAGTGLRATYYPTYSFDGTGVSRVDSTINFNWGSGSPVSGIPVDYFSARWTGQIVAPTTGTYTFYPTGDDGIRLWVDGKLMTNQWQNQSPTEFSNTITLTAGKAVDIRMDYYEWGGGAVAKLAWAGPSIAKQTVPASVLRPTVQSGLSLTYVDPFSATVYGNVTDAMIDHDWGTGSPISGAPVDWFAARWNGKITAPFTGSYTFTTQSDDGVRLEINGQTLVDDWSRHALTADTGTISLVAGKSYDIKVDYYDAAETAVLKLLWQGPTLSQQLVPQSAFTVN